MKVFVTGGTGFIGGALIEKLLTDGHEVRALVRNAEKAKPLVAKGVETIIGDLKDISPIKGALSDCEALFHLGSISRWWLEDKKEYYRVNVLGTKLLMELALEEGVGRIVYTSSLAAIRQPKGMMSRESLEHKGDFESRYSRSKHLAEKEVLSLYREKGLPVVILNPGVVIGPGSVKTFDRMLIEYVNKRLKFIPFPDTVVPLIFIDDVVKAHIQALGAGREGEKYILVGENISIARAFGIVEELTGIAPPTVKFQPSLLKMMVLLWEIKSFFNRKPPKLALDAYRAMAEGAMGDTTKAREELGIEFTPLREALRETLKWYGESGYFLNPVQISL